MEIEFGNIPEDFYRFSLESYIDFFISFLERLNPSIIVERFTGEVPPRFTSITGLGYIRTEKILTMVEKRLEELNTWQGRLYNK
jgi:hypothetical protein